MKSGSRYPSGDSLSVYKMDEKFIYNIFGKLGFIYDICLSITGYKKSIHFFIDAFRKETKSDIKLFLDAGCGTGHYSIAILRKFPNTYGVAFDLQESMITRTKKNLQNEKMLNRVKLFTDDITGSMQKIKGPFDVIIASGILEYTPLESTVKKLSQLLMKGGYFLHAPVRNTLWGKIVGIIYRFRPYSQKQTISAFTENGFKLLRIVSLPSFTISSFKEAHIFQKIE